MSVRRRIEVLENKAEKTASPWKTPPEASVLLKTIERWHAGQEGREPPPYSQEEIEEMHRSDQETTDGQSHLAKLRDDPGWQSEESQELLDWWEEDARRRMALAESGVPLEESYNDEAEDGLEEEELLLEGEDY
jgi:hypothetical protein